MKKLYLTFILFTISTLTFAQWGMLDPTFGGTGKVTMNLSTGFENASDIIQQADGRLIVVGSGTETSTKILVAAYDMDGALDETFGTNGITLVDAPGNVDYGIKGAFQSDGKIIVGARSGDGVYNEFICIRLSADGILDLSFATNGIFTYSFGGSINELNDLKVLDNDKIILAGNAGEDIDNDFALIKLNPDGTSDNSFGTNGSIMFSVTDKFDNLRAIAVKDDGKIIGAGSVYDISRTLIPVLVRFNADGSIDNTFGNEGIVTLTPGPGASFFNDLAITNNNSIIAAGVLDYESQYDFLAAKYNEDGTVDAQFAENGIFEKDYNDDSDYASSLILQPDGKPVLVGYQGNWPSATFALLRLTAEGTPDDTFGDEGLVTTSFTGVYDYASGSAIQQDGKILACGSAKESSDFELAMSRYRTGVTVGMNEYETNLLSTSVFPNPFSDKVTVQFELKESETTHISVFDISGRKVKTLANNINLSQGKQSLSFNLFDLKQGFYFLQIKTSNSLQTVKINKL